MAKGLKRRIKAALVNIDREISDNAQHGRIAGAMASEGYAGGYRDALSDIRLLLDSVEPSDHRGYWRNEP